MNYIRKLRHIIWCQIIFCPEFWGHNIITLEYLIDIFYKDLLLDDYCFVPIGLETFGSWGQKGHKLIKEIGKKLKEITGETRSTFF